MLSALTCGVSGADLAFGFTATDWVAKWPLLLVVVLSVALMSTVVLRCIDKKAAADHSGN